MGGQGGIVTKILSHTYIQVLIGIVAGLLLGLVNPPAAVDMKAFADIFVKLIKMCIGPIVFLAIVHGINAAGNLATAGRVGIKALVYFEVLTTIAMLLGWAAGELLQPGRGINARASDLDPKAIANFLPKGPAAQGGGTMLEGFAAFLPTSLLDPFVQGNVMQILFISIIAGIALLSLGERAEGVRRGVDEVMGWMFSFMGLITRLAPLAAFGAISFTIGKFGLASLLPLLKLVLAYYLAAIVFVGVFLFAILRWCGAPVGAFFRYIKDEILIVFGTIASEAVMPRLITKMEALGCDSKVVRIVMPTAYSFNLDGTALYLVLAPLFIAQAVNIDLAWQDKLSLFLILMLTSKGAAGVTGGVLVTLVTTMTAYPYVPAAGLAITLGVDRFLNEGRAVINLVGNAVAVLAVSRWDGALDQARMRAVLAGADTVARNPPWPRRAEQADL